MAALSVYKSDLSNMLSVVSKIPEDIIDAIGPAPGIGRRNWIELADYLSKDTNASAIRKAALDPNLAPLTSDERFKRVLSSTKAQPIAVQSENWRAASGEPLATVVQNAKRVTVTIDRKKSPEFAAFVLNRLQDLYLEFQAGSSEPS
jgi:ParB family chromosome partitioning protein